LNLGHWTEWDEHWYLTRLGDITAGKKDGVPLSGNEWRSKIRGVGSGRLLNQKILDSCDKLFGSLE